MPPRTVKSPPSSLRAPLGATTLMAPSRGFPLAVVSVAVWAAGLEVWVAGLEAWVAELAVVLAELAVAASMVSRVLTSPNTEIPMACKLADR